VEPTKVGTVRLEARALNTLRKTTTWNRARSLAGHHEARECALTYDQSSPPHDNARRSKRTAKRDGKTPKTADSHSGLAIARVRDNGAAVGANEEAVPVRRERHAAACNDSKQHSRRVLNMKRLQSTEQAKTPERKGGGQTENAQQASCNMPTDHGKTQGRCTKSHL
jgi:hypothetical protein